MFFDILKNTHSAKVKKMHTLKLRLIVVAHIIYMNQAKPNKVIMPAECENQNFCFKIDSNYPDEEIKAVMQKHLGVNHDIDIIDAKETEERIDDKTDEILQPCNSVTKIDPIHYIRDESGDVRYVIQSDRHFVQKFYVVQCSHPGRLQASSIFPIEEEICQHDIRCVNRLVPVQFLVLSHNRQAVEMVTIKDGLPMACSCEYNPYPLPIENCNFYDDGEDDSESEY